MTRTRFTSVTPSAAAAAFCVWSLSGCLVILALGLGSCCRTSEVGIAKNFDSGARDTPAGGDAVGDSAGTTCNKMLIDKKVNGQACGCADECRSGVCAQGVCCSTACDGVCRACNLPGGPGVCGNVAAGQLPAVAGQCKADAPVSCGLDGRCDGAGGCRKFPDGSVCEAGSCQGSAVIGAKICTGGACLPGPATACSPYGCDPANGRCFASCTAAAQCDARACTNGSCGKKPLGATCSAGADCASGSCADGVCCNLACTGPCVSCNQVGFMGECSPVAAGNPDPHGQCKSEAASTCGSSGLCNGAGGCAKFAAGTECRAASCNSGSELPSAICDGEGLCQSGTAIPCAPFQCSGTACRVACNVNEDCVSPNVCTAGSCGKKPNGQVCTGPADCQSGFCVDGVCCNNGCVGTCVSCALTASRGRCTNVAAGTVDPRAMCKDKGAAACDTNGKCNGNKGCQSYGDGTVCKAASCAAATSSLTQVSTCVGGVCKTPTATSCSPFKCSGAGCGTGCATDADCVSPNTCIGGSCGKKPVGQNCSTASECAAGLFCADGVCCQSDCKASCFACNVTGSKGTCVPTKAGDVDPRTMCAVQAPATCGTDGTCDGTGACHKRIAMTPCGDPSCTAGTAKGASFCNGSGTCVAGATTMCAPYVCDVANKACFTSCVGTDNSSCLAPNKCDMAKCGLSPLGAMCTVAADCVSNFCVDGRCCADACTGQCKACDVAGSEGTCSPLPNNTADPLQPCALTAESTCGTDSKCDGAGACRFWDTNTICRQKSCTGVIATNQEKCTTGHTCPGPNTSNCGNIKCDMTAGTCKVSCTVDADCAVGMCDTSNGSCGKKGLGIVCSVGSDCISGNCVDGVCCSTAACAAECTSCAASGTGVCAVVPNDMPDTDTCPNENTACGKTGKCDGNGACKKAKAPGDSCGDVCVGDTVQPRTCDTNGACVNTGAATLCGLFTCDPGTKTCKITCAVDGDCAAGKTCTVPPACQ